MKIWCYRVGSVVTNCYLVADETTRKAFLVDPGEEALRLSGEIRKKGLKLEGILLTHGHFDHIMAVNELRDEFGVKVYASELEKETLEDADRNLSGRMNYTTKADVSLKDGEEFHVAGFLIKALSTPGHTVGGCCYYLASENALFSGDTLFRGSVGRTDFPGGSASVLVRSIEEKLMPLPENTKVYPGHDRETEIGYEKKYNPFLR